MTRRATTAGRWVMVVAAVGVVGACGGDDDPDPGAEPAAEPTASAAAADTTAIGAAADTTEVPTTAATETTATTAATSTTATTEAAETTAAPETTVAPEDWAAEVAAVHEEHLAGYGEHAGEFVETVVASDDAAAEVDAYLALTAATADDLAATLERLPSPPGDPTLAGPYGAFVDGLRAQQQGVQRINRRITRNRQAYVEELRAGLDQPGQPFDRVVRGGYAELRDDAELACFELQAALTERDLGLLRCTPE